MTQSLRVIILEDSPTDAELIQFELQDAGITFTAKVVMSEADFVRELQEFSPDLILSDYDLPKYNGALALTEAKRRCPDTPFILVTGAVTEDRAIDILTQGAKDYVLKSRLEQRLAPAVRRALAEAEEQRARKQAEAELREAHRTLEERVKTRTAELEAEISAHKKTEESLRGSEERQRLVLQASSIGTFEVDLLTGEGQWNATEFELLGLKPGEVKADADTFFRFVHPDDVERLRNEWEEATRSGKLDAEFRMVRADGRECWLAGKGTFIFDGQSDAHDTGTSGKPRRFMGVNFDITERRQSEEALRESEARLRETLHSVTDEIWIVDTQGHIISLSDSVRENLGVTSDKWADIEAALDQLEILRPDGTSRPREDAPLSRALRGEVIRNEAEVIRNLATGQLRWREVSGNPVRNAEGIIMGAVVVVRDITESKQAEKALRESEERLRSLAENVPCVLMRFDRQLHVIYLNKQSDRYNPKPAEEMIGRTNREMGMPQHLCDLWDAAIERVFCTGAGEEMEFDFAGPSGMRTFALKFAPEFGPDHEVRYVLGVSSDITERKAAEKSL